MNEQLLLEKLKKKAKKPFGTPMPLTIEWREDPEGYVSIKEIEEAME